MRCSSRAEGAVLDGCRGIAASTYMHDFLPVSQHAK